MFLVPSSALSVFPSLSLKDPQKFSSLLMISPGPLGRDSRVPLYSTFWRYPDPGCQPHQEVRGPEEPFEARALASWGCRGWVKARDRDWVISTEEGLPLCLSFHCRHVVLLWFKPELAMTQQQWLQVDVDHLACVGWPSLPIWRTVVLPLGPRVVLLSFLFLF